MLVRNHASGLSNPRRRLLILPEHPFGVGAGLPSSRRRVDVERRSVVVASVLRLRCIDVASALRRRCVFFASALTVALCDERKKRPIYHASLWRMGSIGASYARVSLRGLTPDPPHLGKVEIVARQIQHICLSVAGASNRYCNDKRKQQQTLIIRLNVTNNSNRAESYP